MGAGSRSAHFGLKIKSYAQLMQRVIARTDQRERLTGSNVLVLENENENAVDIALHRGRNNYLMLLNGGAIVLCRILPRD